MKQHLDTFRFGSKVMGTDNEKSDHDHGVVVYSGLQTVMHLDTSSLSFPKNKQHKDGDVDYLEMELVNYYRQCYKPSPNFHAIFMGTEPVYLPALELEDIINDTINWKGYLYTCLSFCRNTPDTHKGLIHRAYIAYLAIEQYTYRHYTKSPTLWKREYQSIVHEALHSYTDQTVAMVGDKIKQLEHLAEQAGPDKHKNERRERLVLSLFELVRELED